MNNSDNSFSRGRSFNSRPQSPSGYRGSGGGYNRGGGSRPNNYNNSTTTTRPQSSPNRGPNASASFNSGLQSYNKPVPALAQNTFRVIPLGGQGELGRNCWVFECNQEIIIVDAGIGFVPHGFKGGADLLLPNLDYLNENKEKIKALFISSPHEEYAGALNNLLENLQIPEIYLSDIAAELYKEQIPSDTKIKIIESGQVYEVAKEFKFTPYKVSFSSVGAYAFLIEVLGKKIFYTSAFKIDHTPAIEKSKIEINRLAREVTKFGVELLISNSNNVETLGYTSSEISVSKKITDILKQASGRVIALIACNNIQRMQVLLNSAAAAGRKVCLLGEDTKKWFEAAQKTNYLKFSPDLFEQKSNLPALFIIGSLEGNILKPFISLAYKRHEELELQIGDTIMVSANPPLGSSRMLANAVDQLFVQGVNVIGGRDAGVHVQSYAAQEELKFMYNLTRPKYFLPAQGEARQLVLHAELLGKCGVNPKNAIIVDNGNAIDFDPSKEQNQIVGKVPANPVFFNSDLESELDKQSLDERRSLGEDGTITIVLALNFAKAALIAGPFIKTMGSSFNTNKNWSEIENNLINEIKASTEKALKQGHKEVGIIRHLIHDILSKKIREKFGMSKPLISIVVQEVQ